MKYELSHHQFCGQDRVLVTSIGTFPTLHDAQDAAQDLLRASLNRYMSIGWIGFYCNDVDLTYRGLIAGKVSEHAHVYLSEIQIHARAKVYRTVPSRFEGIGARVPATDYQPANTAHRSYVALVPTESSLTPWRPASTYKPPYQDFNYQRGQTQELENFAQTRPQYPNRNNFFVPRPDAWYDEIMQFSGPQRHGHHLLPGSEKDSTQQYQDGDHLPVMHSVERPTQREGTRGGS